MDAVQSRNPGSSPLSDDLLRACRGLLAGGFGVPQHLYSHCVGTFLDSPLDTADDVAKRQAAKAQPGMGWVQGLQTPRVCFTHNTIQVHNLDRLGQTTARRLWGLHTEAPEQAARNSLWVYHAVTERGLIRWGAHLRTMARREGVRDMRGTPAPAPLAKERWGPGIGSLLAHGDICSGWPCIPNCTCAWTLYARAGSGARYLHGVS